MALDKKLDHRSYNVRVHPLAILVLTSPRPNDQDLEQQVPNTTVTKRRISPDKLSCVIPHQQRSSSLLRIPRTAPESAPRTAASTEGFRARWQRLPVLPREKAENLQGLPFLWRLGAQKNICTWPAESSSTVMKCTSKPACGFLFLNSDFSLSWSQRKQSQTGVVWWYWKCNGHSWELLSLLKKHCLETPIEMHQSAE